MKDYILYTLRLDNKMHDQVRDLAHVLKVHMSEVIRDGINLKLEQIKKPLTKRNVAL
jgi:hypothetical protein